MRTWIKQLICNHKYKLVKNSVNHGTHFDDLNYNTSTKYLRAVAKEHNTSIACLYCGKEINSELDKTNLL